MESEERGDRFDRPTFIEQFDSLPLEDFQQELECRFVDESYSFYSYDLILPNTRDGLELCDDFTDLPFPERRLVVGFDVGRSHDRSDLALFKQVGGRYVCRLLRSYDRVPFAEQAADLSRMLNMLPIARLSIDQSGVGMTTACDRRAQTGRERAARVRRTGLAKRDRNLAENLGRACPQVVGEAFTSASKERRCTDFKILRQRRDVYLPRDRELVAQIHNSKRRFTPSGKRFALQIATTALAPLGCSSRRSAPAAATPTSSGPSCSPARRSAGRAGGPRRRWACG